MTIKVNRARLIKAIEVKRAEVLAEYRSEGAKVSEAFVEYRGSVMGKVLDFTKKVREAKTVSDITSQLTYGQQMQFPKAPERLSKPNTGKYDDALRRLALVEDDTVTLSEKGDGDFLSLI